MVDKEALPGSFAFLVDCVLLDVRERLEGPLAAAADGLAAARRLDFPSVDETERLALTES
jgi:hypothetical protein